MSEPRIGIIAFARMSSSRLPGKALMDSGGRPMLGRVIDRLRLAALDLDCKLIIATSQEQDDDQIAAFCEDAKNSTPDAKALADGLPRDSTYQVGRLIETALVQGATDNAQPLQLKTNRSVSQ